MKNFDTGARRSPFSAAALAVFSLAAVHPVRAQVGDFRITEVDPAAGRVEITNTGGAHTTPGAHPFCHRFRYADTIPSRTSFAAGEILLFDLPSLDATDSDLWLYTSGPFGSAGNIVHGLKYGPAENVGRTALASGVGLWSGASDHAPVPPASMTLVWDGFGFGRSGWFVDETPTLGAPDAPSVGTVPSSLAAPSSIQDFESVLLGDEVDAIVDWVIVDSSAEAGAFTVRVVNDVLGDNGADGTGAGNGPPVTPPSTRWLRVRDQDAGDAQNRFYSPPITPASASDYAWSFYVNVESPFLGGGGNSPRLVVQHDAGSGGGFANAWGVEFARETVNLVVTGIGGPESSVPLYAYGDDRSVGDWVKIDLAVDFDAGMVFASADDDGNFATAPVALNGDPANFRFCYRGEGVGNTGTMLIDEISVEVADVDGPSGDPVCGDADMNGSLTATDALIALATAVGGGTCDPCLCDVLNSDGVTATDALAILAAAVGQGAEFVCPMCS
jgi:hypothetical protein